MYDLFGDSFLNQIRLKNKIASFVADNKSTPHLHEDLSLNSLKKIKFRPLAYIANKQTENLEDVFEGYQAVGKIKLQNRIVFNYGKQIKTEKNKDSHQVNYNFCDKLFTNLVLLRKYSN